MTQSEGICPLGFEELLSRIIVGSMIVQHGVAAEGRIRGLQVKIEAVMARYRGRVH